MNTTKLRFKAITLIALLSAIGAFSTSVCLAQLAVDYSSARDNHSLRQIKVDGVNLLQGSGFHIIGSKSNADDLNNVASESPHNSNGVMRPYNNNVSGGGEVPYSLTFKKDSVDPSKIAFNISVGKPSTSFGVMLFPLEANMNHFSYFRHGGGTDLKRYDELPFGYKNENGNYYLESISPSVVWAEMIGPVYTIRVTITASSVPIGLFVVNAPGLGGGIRDLDFGFKGGLPAQQRRTASGTIQVFRTNPSLLPTLTVQSETTPYHQVGKRSGSTWRVDIKDPARNYLQYGPYIAVAPVGGNPKGSATLTAGPKEATFRLLVENNSANNARVFTVDVYDSASGRQLSKLDISRKTFRSANVFQDFSLRFDAKPGQRLEFRTFWWGESSAKQDLVSMR
jgi:hypothetical protein